VSDGRGASQHAAAQPTPAKFRSNEKRAKAALRARGEFYAGPA